MALFCRPDKASPPSGITYKKTATFLTPGGAALTGPTVRHYPVGRIRHRRHPTATFLTPGGATLTGPTVWHYPVGRIRHRRHPA
ncbi:hypothetical protein AM352_19490 [Citrobacter koseri]|nr:hypothetical protein AM352_19490 [Citrobacter koseri]PWY08813.1 hypothetical protein DL345_03855 [Citrobacter koseri]